MKISSSTPNYMAYTNPANQASQTEAAVTNKEKPADGSKTDSINLSAKPWISKKYQLPWTRNL
jgi:hypothetical protein